MAIDYANPGESDAGEGPARSEIPAIGFSTFGRGLPGIKSL